MNETIVNVTKGWESYNNIVTFKSWSTVSVVGASVGGGKRVWWEVSVLHVGGGLYIGCAGENFNSRYVGSCTNSYSYMVHYNESYKYHNNYEQRYGKLLQRNVQHTIGVALDTITGAILFSMDGDWTQPMGVAYTNLNTNNKFFPAVSGWYCKVSVNFGEKEFKYGPPDNSYVGLIDAV